MVHHLSPPPSAEQVFFEEPAAEPADTGIPDVSNSTRERDTVDNGVDRSYEGGYSEMISFTGYSSTSLCTRYNRTEHLNGHTKCPLVKDWYQMWRPDAKDLAALDCWKDDMIPIQKGQTLSNPPGTTTILAGCPKPGSDPDFKFKAGQYDFRYGGAPLFSLHGRDLNLKFAHTGC